MEKDDFIKIAPMYYALAIAAALKSTPDDGYLYEQAIKNEYAGEEDHWWNCTTARVVESARPN